MEPGEEVWNLAPLWTGVQCAIFMLGVKRIVKVYYFIDEEAETERECDGQN